MIEIGKIRELMANRGVDAIVVGDSDPHFSEYPADCFCLRSFLSGFDGSNGTLVVTKNDAALWTDSRYYLQAAEQLKPSGIRMVKQESEGFKVAQFERLDNGGNWHTMGVWSTETSVIVTYINEIRVLATVKATFQFLQVVFSDEFVERFVGAVVSIPDQFKWQRQGVTHKCERQ